MMCHPVVDFTLDLFYFLEFIIILGVHCVDVVVVVAASIAVEMLGKFSPCAFIKTLHFIKEQMGQNFFEHLRLFDF